MHATKYQQFHKRNVKTQKAIENNSHCEKKIQKRRRNHPPTVKDPAVFGVCHEASSLVIEEPLRLLEDSISPPTGWAQSRRSGSALMQASVRRPAQRPRQTHTQIRVGCSFISLNYLLSKFRSQNRANHLWPARILISSAKHSREPPRVLEPASPQNPLYKRVRRTAICHYSFSRGLRKKSFKNSLTGRLILCDPRPKVICKRTSPSERVPFHTARTPQAIRETWFSAIHGSQYSTSVCAKRLAIGLQNVFQ